MRARDELPREDVELGGDRTVTVRLVRLLLTAQDALSTEERFGSIQRGRISLNDDGLGVDIFIRSEDGRMYSSTPSVQELEGNPESLRRMSQDLLRSAQARRSSLAEAT